MAKRAKATAITVIGRRWFERLNGNTYHSVEVMVNGVQVYRLPCSYGYGSMYAQNAFVWLKKSGLLVDLQEHESLYSYCQRRQIIYTDSVSDVKRKRDL